MDHTLSAKTAKFTSLENLYKYGNVYTEIFEGLNFAEGKFERIFTIYFSTDQYCFLKLLLLFENQNFMLSKLTAKSAILRPSTYTVMNINNTNLIDVSLIYIDIINLPVSVLQLQEDVNAGCLADTFMWRCT